MKQYEWQYVYLQGRCRLFTCTVLAKDVAVATVMMLLYRLLYKISLQVTVLSSIP